MRHFVGVLYNGAEKPLENDFLTCRTSEHHLYILFLGFDKLLHLIIVALDLL